MSTVGLASPEGTGDHICDRLRVGTPCTQDEAADNKLTNKPKPYNAKTHAPSHNLLNDVDRPCPRDGLEAKIIRRNGATSI